MGNSPIILNTLARLDELCPAGYAIALHISFTTPKFLFQTYNKDWIDLYSKQGLVLKDPTVRWGFENTGTALWSDLKPSDSDGVLQKAESFGLNHGFTFSTDTGGSKSISSFSRSDRTFTGDEIGQIQELAELLHVETANRDSMTEQDRDALRKMSVEFTHG